MLFVLPAIVVIFEKWNWILVNTNEAADTKNVPFRRFPYARSVVAVSLLISMVVLFASPNLSFQYDFGKLEPKVKKFDDFNKVAGQVDQSDKRNPAYILADNRQQVIEIVDKLRYKMLSLIHI